MKKLTPLQEDALTEIINIGVGKAAGMLNDIIGTHVTLNVPKLDLYPLADLQVLIKDFKEESTSAVFQGFDGDIDGSAALVFPAESAVKLVSALTGEDVSSSELDTVRIGTLMEVGNIVINSIIGTLCNIFGSSLDFKLPEYMDGNVTSLIGNYSAKDKSGIVIWAKSGFLVKELEINGYLLIIISMENIEVLLNMVDDYISGEKIAEK